MDLAILLDEALTERGNAVMLIARPVDGSRGTPAFNLARAWSGSAIARSAANRSPHIRGGPAASTRNSLLRVSAAVALCR